MFSSRSVVIGEYRYLKETGVMVVTGRSFGNDCIYVFNFRRGVQMKCKTSLFIKIPVISHEELEESNRSTYQ